MPSLVSILQQMRSAAGQMPRTAAPPVFGAAQAHVPLALHGPPMSVTVPPGWGVPSGAVQPHPPASMVPPGARFDTTQLTPAQEAALAAATGGARPGVYQQSPGAGTAGDRYDPRARAYARARLMAAVRSGAISRYLPEWDADPTAAWRGVSQLMAQGGYFNQPRGVNPRIGIE